MDSSDTLIFFVNGQKIEDKNVDPSTTLASYLRDTRQLKGTKIGCNEGGCGACVVMVSEITDNDFIKHYSVNACLTLACSLHGKAVTTVEGIGSVRSKLHPVQERLSKGNGSQCGFCTPGFIMAMYSLLRNNPNPTKKEIDEGLQGNLCRCTGYRPILESFYSFANDTVTKCSKANTMVNGICCQNGVGGCQEEKCSKRSSGCQTGSCCKEPSSCQFGDGCQKGSGCCQPGENKVKHTLQDAVMKSTCYDPSQELLFPAELKLKRYDREFLKIQTKDERHFYRPTSLSQMLSLKNLCPQAKIVVGNTEVGIEMKFKNFSYPVLISSNGVNELKVVELKSDGFFVGSAVTLTDMEVGLKHAIEKLPEIKSRILVAFSKMLHWFAGKHIRNSASAIGNLITASPISDLNPLFVASGSVVVVESEKRGRRELIIDDKFFVKYRQTCLEPDEVAIGVRIPFSAENEHFAGYKQAQRREDDIAIVNAGMWVKFRSGTSTIEDLRLSFGGMAPTTVLVRKATFQIIGRCWSKELIEDSTLKLLLENLPLPPGVPGGMEKFRQTLCISFFLKFFITVSHDLYLAEVLENDVDSSLSSIYESENYSPMKATQIYSDVRDDQARHDAVGRPLMHLSGERHTTGEAVYCDDVQVAGALHGAFVTSRRAHAKIIKVDASNALKLKGVVDYIDNKDVPAKGTNVFGFSNDQTMFAPNEVSSFGQIIGLIVADTHEIARKAAEVVVVEYEDLPAIVTIEQAINAKSYIIDKPLEICNNNPDQVLDNAERIFKGEVRLGGQEHFYLETQCCVVIPKEDQELEIIVATQNVTEVQLEVAKALGISAHKVVARVKRIGGGFGGKETAPLLLALPCAVAATKLHRPVRCTLERFDDMVITGGRHPFLGRYKMALNNELQMTAFKVDMYGNAGYNADLSYGVMFRAITHVDNSYTIPHLYASGRICKTNTASSTAFRGFGSPQAMFIIEHCITDVAYSLGIAPEKLREKNLNNEGDKTYFSQTLVKCNMRRCWNECVELSQFDKRRNEVDDFNKKNRVTKRGIAVIPTKYGINFGLKHLCQAGALVHIYRDGSVLVSHAGMEMGQGLHTKMAQVATRVLGVPVELIYINDTSTDKVPNTSATAASLGSDLNGEAVKKACEILLDRLKPVMVKYPTKSWPEVVEAAYHEQINLSANGFYKNDFNVYNWDKNHGEPYDYFVYGVACCEVQIDCLTGDHKILRTDIVMDVGDSLNPAVDIGQIEGAFVQGYGLYTMEETKLSPTGVVYTRGPGTYKIPSVDDVPRQFNVKLLKGSSNPKAIFSSKAIGEPPLFLGSAAFFAIKDAIKATRSDLGLTGPFRMDSPATPERIRLLCEDKLSSLVHAPTVGTYQPWTVQL